jgi:micrococcal nuclease
VPEFNMLGSRLRIVVGVVVVAVVLILTGEMPAAAQVQVIAPSSATVTLVIDGDTLVARLADGSEVTVRLIGIDTPETQQAGVPVECGGPQATEALRQLADGQPVNLVSDPTQDAVDRFGRSLFYVDRTADGLDVGEEMLRRGFAEVFVFERDFQRLPPYRDAQAEARDFEEGVWRNCGGDFHLTRAEAEHEARRSAVDFIRRCHSAVSRRRFATAWGLLGRRVRRDIGSFRRWRAGHRRTLEVSVLSARARLSRGRAVVSVRLRSRDRDACSRRVVRQYFRGRWLLAPSRDDWVAVRVTIRKTRGGRVRLSKSECPTPQPPTPPEPPHGDPAPIDCQGYNPCLQPGPDVDCAGGSGNGPRYVEGPVSVSGSDPYGLDSDGDGMGCED